MPLVSQTEDFVLYDDSFNGLNDGNASWGQTSNTIMSWQVQKRPDGGIGVMGGRPGGPSATLYLSRTQGFNFNAAEAGNHISFYVHITTPQLLRTLSNGGGLFLTAGSSAVDYFAFLIASGDDHEQLGVGFKKFSFDPRKTPRITVGTPTLTDIRFFGVSVHLVSGGPYPTTFLGGMRIERPLIITGTSTSFWDDLSALKPGRVLKEHDHYLIQGGLQIGAANATTEVSDTSKKIVFENPRYHTTSWGFPLRADTPGITLISSGSGSTSFQDGVPIGDSYGMDGSVFECIEDALGEVDASGMSTANSVLKLYDSHFIGFENGITIGGPNNLGTHILHTAVVERCGTLDFGPSSIRDVEVINTTSLTAAAVMSVDSDIRDSKFLGNTTGPALRFTPYSATFNLYDLKFAGNTYDLYNSNAALITVNQYDGSNATTYTGNIQLETPTDITLRIEGNVSLVGAEVRIYDLDGLVGDYGTELAGVESCGTSFFEFLETPGNTVWIQIMLQGYEEYGKKVLIPQGTSHIFTANLQRDFNL